MSSEEHVRQSVVGRPNTRECLRALLGALYLKDLAQKTRRGQAGVVRDGRHNGGHSYGYRSASGQPGVLEILDTEAAIVRRIFECYAAGRSPRDIAAALNRDGVSGPVEGLGMLLPLAAAGSAQMAFFTMNSIRGVSFGIGSASSKTRRLAAALVAPIRSPTG